MYYAVIKYVIFTLFRKYNKLFIENVILHWTNFFIMYLDIKYSIIKNLLPWRYQHQVKLFWKFCHCRILCVFLRTKISCILFKKWFIIFLTWINWTWTQRLKNINSCWTITVEWPKCLKLKKCLLKTIT